MPRRKKDKNVGGLIMGGIIIFLMVTSVIGFISMGGTSTTPTSTVNGQKFTLTNQGWQTTLDGEDYYVSYLPNEIGYFTLPDGVSLGTIGQIDTTSSYNATLRGPIAQSIFELSTVLSTKGVYFRNGFTEVNPFDLPVITCENATSFVPVISYVEGNNTGVRKEGDCIIIEADSATNVLALTDLLIYNILGI